VTNISNQSIIGFMDGNERLDPKSGFYRGWKACLTVVLRFLIAEQQHGLANIMESEFKSSHVLKHYREKSPQYRRSKFKLIKGGKDE
jgi:hypothetical protein